MTSIFIIYKKKKKNKKKNLVFECNYVFKSIFFTLYSTEQFKKLNKINKLKKFK
jgi:hypothetical protein